MRKFLSALLATVLVFTCAGCKKEGGTIDGATDEQAEEFIGRLDAPEYDELDEFLDEQSVKK